MNSLPYRRRFLRSFRLHPPDIPREFPSVDDQIHWGRATVNETLLQAGERHVPANHLKRRVGQHLLQSQRVADFLNEVVRRERVPQEVRVYAGDLGACTGPPDHLLHHVHGEF